MHIVQIVSGMHIASAGPSYSIARLADELRLRGEEVSIMTSGHRPQEWPYDTPLYASRRWLDNRLSMSPGLVGDVRRLSRDNDIMHGHSMWRFTNNVYPLVLSRNIRAKIVCSPRGSMSAWSMQYKGLLKQPFWRYIQKPALERCHLFHATAQAEYEDIRKVGLHAPVAIIPNGVDLPDLPANPDRRRRVVFLGRINPVKGVDMLINAWRGIHAGFPDWELVIAGPPTEDYAGEMKKLALSAEGGSGIHFAGEVLGKEKTRLLTSASLFVLPSHSENFGMVVAEALSHGVPVITTTGTPWSGLIEYGCGWYVPPEQANIAGALKDALTRPVKELQSMGETGRDWMGREFSWPHVAEMMLTGYQWLNSGGKLPDHIITD